MITHARFAQSVAYLASSLAKWSADCLTLPEEHALPMRDEPVMRFLRETRQRLDYIEQMHKERTAEAGE